MTNESSFVPRVSGNDESVDDRAERLFIDFVKRSGYTGGEMREAYYQLCGVGETEEMSDTVSEILSHMKGMVDAHFPLNRLAILVESKEMFDTIPERVIKLIDTLPVSSNEKKILTSILDRQRSGTLSFYTTVPVGSGLTELFSEKISAQGSREERAVILAALIKAAVDRVSGTGIEITFEEE
jgi:hypothetical protein